MDNIWDVPTILESCRHRLYAEFKDVPAMGYKTFEIKGASAKTCEKAGIAKENKLENDKLSVTVNSNGTLDVTYKETGKESELCIHAYTEVQQVRC